jgi:hypothetical protein
MSAFKAQLNKTLQAIGIWRDTWRSGWHLVEASMGRFYVRYPDGQRSQRFYYSTACDYAEMFGGSVIHIPTGRKMHQRGGLVSILSGTR